MEEKLKKHYNESIDLLRKLIACDEKKCLGFVASAVDKENYRRLFSRDAFWTGIGALYSGEEDLISGYKKSLITLAENQREDGAIPSNVADDGRVSYGVVSTRIDSTTLFIIGVFMFYRFFSGEESGDMIFHAAEKAIKYLEETWESPETGLLFIPRAGNWADEYFQEGYVLYDETLWVLVLSGYSNMLEKLNKPGSKRYMDKATKAAKLVRDKFWIRSIKEDKNIYMLKVRRAFDLEEIGFFMHFYHIDNKYEKDFGYAHKVFDAFGNILVLLSGIASGEQSRKIIKFIDQISTNDYPLIPAHYPIVSEKVFRSYKLEQYRFKEYLGHYHNGGLWPWYTGLYVAYLAKIGDTERAERYLKGIYKANTMRENNMTHYEYHMNKAATVDTTVKHKDGVGLFLSAIMKSIVLDRKSTVLIKYNNHKVDVTEDMEVRNLRIPQGSSVKIIAIGPDADLVLEDIMVLSSEESACFSNGPVKIKKNKPYGTPYLGVSAAAYITGYKALYERKYVF